MHGEKQLLCQIQKAPNHSLQRSSQVICVGQRRLLLHSCWNQDLLGNNFHRAVFSIRRFSCVRHFAGNISPSTRPFVLKLEPGVIVETTCLSRAHRGVCAVVVLPMAFRPEADSLPRFDSPLVQGASRTWYTD